MTHRCSRRSFTKNGVKSVLAISGCCFLGSFGLFGCSKDSEYAAKSIHHPHVPKGKGMVIEQDVDAKKIAYHHNSNSVNARKFPEKQSFEKCANCAFFKPYKKGHFGACSKLDGRYVPKQGWCAVYKPQGSRRNV